MDKTLSNKWAILFFMTPAMLFLSIFYLIPIVETGILSLTQWNGVSLSNITITGMSNFTKLFQDQIFWAGIKNTLIILLFQIFLQIPITIILALLLNRVTKGVRFYKTAFFVPFVFSATAVGLLWNRLYDVDYGLINRVFSMIGLEHQAWLSHKSTVIIALIAPMIWRSIGYYLIIMYAGIKSIPKDYREAAMIDGCNGVQSALKITLPLMRNAINVCVVLTAVAALREYPLIYVMTAGGPFNSSSTPAIQMYTESFLKMNYGYGSAISIILVLECLLVSFVINKVYPSKDIKF